MYRKYIGLHSLLLNYGKLCTMLKDEVVLSKIVLSNFHPKQVNEWIGDPRGSIIELFIAILI